MNGKKGQQDNSIIHFSTGSTSGDKMKYPEKPERPKDPRKSTPDYKRDCPCCGKSEEIHEMKSEREKISSQQYRIDYWCTNCEEYIGTKFGYDGPIPVKTHNGWELH